MSWFSREINLMTLSVIFVDMSLRIFLLTESIRNCLLLRCPCLYSQVNVLYSLSFCFQMSTIKCSSAKRPYSRCYMSPLDYFRFLIWAISTLQTLYSQVCQSNAKRVSAFCHKLCSDVYKKKKKKKIGLGSTSKLTIPISGKMPRSPPIPILQIGSGHPYTKDTNDCGYNMLIHLQYSNR